MGYSKEEIDNYFLINNKKFKNYAFSILRDSEIVGDLVNDAYLGCLEKKEVIQEECGGVVPYAFRIIRNHCFKIIKRRGKFIKLESLSSSAVSYNDCFKEEFEKNADNDYIEKQYEIDEKVKIALETYGTFQNAVEKIKEINYNNKRILHYKNKNKEMLYVKLKQQSHIKIIYKKKVVWFKIENRKEDVFEGYIETIGSHYLKKMSIPKEAIVGIPFH